MFGMYPNDDTLSLGASQLFSNNYTLRYMHSGHNNDLPCCSANLRTYRMFRSYPTNPLVMSLATMFYLRAL